MVSQSLCDLPLLQGTSAPESIEDDKCTPYAGSANFKSQSMFDLPLVYDTFGADASEVEMCKPDWGRKFSRQSTSSESTTASESIIDFPSDLQVGPMLDQGAPSPSPRRVRFSDREAVMAYFVDRHKGKSTRYHRKYSSEPVRSKMQPSPPKAFETGSIFACIHNRIEQSLPVAMPASSELHVAKEDFPLIFFDWDDTLLPTWYLTEVVRHCLSEQEWQVTGISEDSPFYKPLEAHAQLIRKTLQSARKVARVAIVTLAARPWVNSSADKFLPTLHLDYLLQDLGIPVYYAREYVPMWQVQSEDDGINMFVVAKRNAMAHFVRKCSRKKKMNCRNVISVGDSENERHALREVLWSRDDDSWCKVAKLACDPLLAQLTDELQVLCSSLPQMVAYAGDFDIDLGSACNVGQIKEELQLV